MFPQPVSVSGADLVPAHPVESVGGGCHTGLDFDGAFGGGHRGGFLSMAMLVVMVVMFVVMGLMLVTWLLSWLSHRP